MANADSTGGVNVAKEVAAMRRMTTGELQAKYAQVFGEATRSHHKQYLIRRIAWRMQANAEGGLSERALQRAKELANDADLRVTAPKTINIASKRTKAKVPSNTDRRLPMHQSEIVRDYKGQRIVVKVRENGFEYEGEVYKSLSAVAKAITGSHWNGYRFFGLCTKGGVA